MMAPMKSPLRTRLIAEFDAVWERLRILAHHFDDAFDVLQSRRVIAIEIERFVKLFERFFRIISKL